MERWKSSIIQSELTNLVKKINKLEEDLKLERDMNAFDRTIRTRKYEDL